MKMIHECAKARRTRRPDSDVDVLVEFEPGHVIGLRIAQMEQELAEKLGGRAVDLRTR